MKKNIILLTVLCLLTCSAAMAETVVTSFYPIWLLTRNLTMDIPELDVRNLAAPETGCLHDYQLQTGDMKVLDAADLFLINGAGMESYLTPVMNAFPELKIVEASAGIELLTDTMGAEIGEREESVNAHIWLDARNAIRMTENLAQGLAEAFPQYADRIDENRDRAVEKLTQLDESLKEGLSGLKHRDIITFHEAFPYFAKAYGLNVVAVVNREPGETVSPVQMAELIRIVKELDNPPLFTEPQYEELNAQIIARETGTSVFQLDPIVTGPGEDVPYDWYEQRMLQNMDILRQALDTE